MIDTHQHFWNVDDRRYHFPSRQDGVIYRNFGPDDLTPAFAKAGVDRSIAVQAAEGEWETVSLLDQSRRFPWIAGVVGWCDLASPDASAVIDSYRAAGPLVGIRPMLQKQDDASWLLLEPASRNLRHLVQAGIVFEALVDVRHLAVIVALAERHPDLAIVVDHMAKPWRHPTRQDEWSAGIQGLSGFGNVAIKVSGYPFEPGSPDPIYRRLCTVLLEWFGLERLLWGSDWPVCTRHVPYEEAARRAQAAFPADTWNRVSDLNARRIYGLAAFLKPQPSSN